MAREFECDNEFDEIDNEDETELRRYA